jgi:MFS superfamily sulfate permease-like transporter
VLLGLKRVAPGVPAALLVVVGGIVVVALGDLTARGVAARVRPHRGHRRGAPAAVPGPAPGGLGAVVISAVIGFLDLAAMERVRRLLRDSFAIALVAMAAVLALGVLQGLILAVVVSVGELLIRSSRPSRSVLGRLPGSTTFVARENAPEARTVPGMLVYRLNAPLLFVNAKRLRDGIRAELRDADQRVPKVVLLDLSFAPRSTSPA